MSRARPFRASRRHGAQVLAATLCLGGMGCAASPIEGAWIAEIYLDRTDGAPPLIGSATLQLSEQLDELGTGMDITGTVLLDIGESPRVLAARGRRFEDTRVWLDAEGTGEGSDCDRFDLMDGELDREQDVLRFARGTYNRRGHWDEFEQLRVRFVRTDEPSEEALAVPTGCF